MNKADVKLEKNQNRQENGLNPLMTFSLKCKTVIIVQLKKVLLAKKFLV